MESNDNPIENDQQPQYYDINQIDNLGPFPQKPQSDFKNYHDFKFESMQTQLVQPSSELLNQDQRTSTLPSIPSNYVLQQQQQQLLHLKQPNQKKEDPMKQYQSQLKEAYNIFLVGDNHSKAMNYYYALDSYTNSLKIVETVYPNIVNDQKLKTTTDAFLKSLKQKIEAANVQIKTRFEIKTKGSYDKACINNSQIKELLNQEVKSEQNQKPRYIVREIKQTPTPKTQQHSSKIIKEDEGNTIEKQQGQKSNKKEGLQIVGNDLREKVLSEIIDSKPGIVFHDVIGLGAAKQTLREIIIIPNLRPDLFTGLRSPPRGLLLFGPPGTGKTMIAKAVATECKCTFFNISASSLTSKYVGESEKLVRALFELANEKEPSVVFIDEIESILSKRNESENEAMKRLKTEFLIQFDGVGSNQKSHVLIIGATNRPQELDPAVIRRLPKRVYIGPFDEEDRKLFVQTIVKQNDSIITDEEFGKIAKICTNYSNSDLKELCREAAYEPLREISGNMEQFRSANQLRPICYDDFDKAIKKVRGTLTTAILDEMEKWNKQFGALN